VRRAGGWPLNLEARDKGGLTPLLSAVRKGHQEVVSLLLAAGANPLATDLVRARTWLVTALVCESCPVTVFRRWMVVGRGQYGTTTLIYACRLGDPALVDVVLRQPGTDVNARNHVGARRQGLQGAGGKWLGALPACAPSPPTAPAPAGVVHWQAGQTALHAACGCGHEEAVEMLLEEPYADRNPRDKVGATAKGACAAWSCSQAEVAGAPCRGSSACQGSHKPCHVPPGPPALPVPGDPFLPCCPKQPPAHHRPPAKVP
jgi:hypothetical protein